MNKIFDIAFKDMSQSFRSAFALVFMFAVPLMIAGIFSLMFGSSSQKNEFKVPVTSVIVANLDEGDPAYSAIASGIGNGAAATLGDMVVETLNSPNFSSLLKVTSAASAEEARQAVNDQKAGVAVILPPHLSSNFMQESQKTTLELYSDPTLTLGPGIVRSIIQQVMDSVSGMRIAVHLTEDAVGTQDQAQIGAVMQQYLASQTSGTAQDSLVVARSTAAAAPSTTFTGNIVAWIMGGMSIFYAFYTGFASAQSILREEEHKTLPRLFTTPTPQAYILAGKFLAVFLTVIVQIIVLLIAGMLIFKISWGGLPQLAVVVTAIVLAASTFGIFFNSLLKNSKQAGAVFGGVITITGMLGMLPIFTMGVPGASWSKLISLFVPQGWAVQALFQSMQHAPWTNLAGMVGGMLVWSVIFFAAGVWRFNHRYI